ncbi:alpha/beta hydrolase-fold protein [Sphingomonas sp. DG1-23]|uniref:alpha/beta hydrolase n=1 Tax=Sphingomonas sp. DG1-23 TaxID=3068316 RepID=UPI00273F20E3|nr:alpha/beta hydrolase-fold protein [Sphingomonas sp. DG1-23]MDP5280097.1 alpha/beta hydrolase-fold protein [Sphingomonas sp. DG1-23]
MTDVASRRLLGVAVLTLGAPLSPPLAAAQTAPVATPTTGYVLPESETWELKSEDGYPYQIFVSQPKDPPPPGGYPVLYVLDGNAMFAGFAETRRILGYMKADLGKTIIVGVGYKTEAAYDVRRIYDFVEDFRQPVPPAQTYLTKYKAGGRAQFAAFLLDRLRPVLARRYSVNPHRQALFGHSFGGLFALYMLYNHPGAFHAIVSASPSIFWNDQGILAEERAFTAKLTQGKLQGPVSRLRLVTGELDETALERTDAVSLAKRLEPLSAYGLRSEFEMFAGETHITVPSRSITSTLRFAFTWP